MASNYSRNRLNISDHWLLLGASILAILLQLSAASWKCEKSAISSEDKALNELLTAVKRNDAEVVQSLSDEGADIRIKTTSGQSLLELAVICECADVTEALIKLGLDPNTINDNGESPLWTAVDTGNVTIMETLRRNGAEIGVRRGNYGDSLLHEACRKGNDEIVSWLLDAGIELDIRNNQTETPLHIAAENGHQILVQMLIARGASVDSREKDGNTPLHEAASSGHLAIVQNLLRHGAKVNSSTLSGMTALHKAAEGGHDMVIEELIIHGADPDSGRTILGLGPLHMAAYNLNAVKVLLRNGADVNMPTYNGAKPIHWVGYGDSLDQADVVQVLLERGAAVNGVMKNGWTPLHLAALYGSERIIEKLIYSGAELNAMDSNGRTPLHYVTVRNSPELIQLFIESGADVHVTDNDWETPYSWAMSRGLFTIADPLSGLNTENI